MNSAAHTLTNAIGSELTARDVSATTLGLTDADGTTGIKNAFLTSVTNGMVTGVTQVSVKTTNVKGSIYATPDMPNSYFATSGSNDYAIVKRSDGSGIAYTNKTDFSKNAKGQFENSAGDLLMGIPFNPDGTLPPIISSNLQVVTLGNISSKPTPTSRIDVAMRIPASKIVGTTEVFTAQIYDSLGVPHTATYTLTKTAANAWNLTAAVTGGNITNPAGAVAVTFNNDGTLATIGGAAIGTQAYTFDFSAGGANNAQAVSLNLGTPGQANGLVQAGDTSVTFSVVPDGSQASQALSDNFASSGIISSTFVNGIAPIPRFQIILGVFPNPNGLHDVKGTAKLATTESGPVSLQIPGQGNAGVLAPGSLTKSNVDRTRAMLDLTTNATTVSYLGAALSQSFDVEKGLIQRL